MVVSSYYLRTNVNPQKFVLLVLETNSGVKLDWEYLEYPQRCLCLARYIWVTSAEEIGFLPRLIEVFFCFEIEEFLPDSAYIKSSNFSLKT